MNVRHRFSATLLATTPITITVLTPVSAHSLTTSRAPAGDPIYIGQLDPLTGVAAAGPGLYQKAGAVLAVRQSSC